MLNQNIIDSINDSVLCWLATVNELGEPNVSPKEMFTVNGSEHILIANIASPNSIKNIYSNPSVCLSFINIFKQKGYKVKGIANLIEKDSDDYQTKESVLRTLGGEQFEIKSIIEILVNSVAPIIAPSYLFFPETTESSQIQQAMDAYGVKPGDI